MRFDYQDASGLRVRREFYGRYSTRTVSWNSWIVADILAAARPLTILDVGGGYGSVWSEIGGPFRIDVVLTDISLGMLLDAPGRLRRAVMSAERLAVKDRAFDVITAFNVLYHVKRRDVAYREIVRALKPQGMLVFTTIGSNHLRELRDLIDEHLGRFPGVLMGNDCPLEQAAEEARRFFADVTVDIFPDALLVDRAGPIVEYVRTTPLGRCLTGDHYRTLERELRSRCSAGRGLAIRTEAAKLVCRGALQGG